MFRGEPTAEGITSTKRIKRKPISAFIFLKKIILIYRDWIDWWMRTALGPWLRETSTGTDTAGAPPTGSFARRQSEREQV